MGVRCAHGVGGGGGRRYSERWAVGTGSAGSGELVEVGHDVAIWRWRRKKERGLRRCGFGRLGSGNNVNRWSGYRGGGGEVPNLFASLSPGDDDDDDDDDDEDGVFFSTGLDYLSIHAHRHVLLTTGTTGPYR